MEKDFADRDVVVTGGTGALGRGVVGLLVERGARCHVPCVDESELEGFGLEGREGVNVVIGLDMRDEATVEGFYSDLPGLWASVHCAGGFAMGGVERCSAGDFAEQMGINAVTCFLCCREAVKRLRTEGGGGRIVNVAARPALEARTGAGMVAYTAAKAAVSAITRALGEEVVEDEILVNAVAPSMIDTPANREAMADADHSAWPTPREIASTIVFLASPGNTVTRSAVVPVYGRV